MFDLLNIKNFSNFFGQNSHFFQVFENLSFFKFFQLQGPGNLIWGLLIGHCVFSSNNGMVFNRFFDKVCKFFKVSKSFCQFLIVVHSQLRENLFHVLIKSYCMVFSFNESVSNNLIFRLLEISLIEFAIFYKF